MYLLYSFQQGLLGNIAEFFHRVLIWLFLFVDTFVYWLINLSYQAFLAISQIRIFSDEDIYDLSQRIYILIGVFALFFVAYALLTAIVNPDNIKKDDKSLGKIIPNIAIAIIGIAIVPAAFNIMYDVQHAVLCGNVIPKLVLGNAYSDGFDIENQDANKLGSQMSTLLFKSFFYVQDENGNPVDLSQADTLASTIYENDCNGSSCLTLSQAYKNAENGSSFFSFRNFSDAVVDGKVGYFFIVSTLAGGFCVYVLVSLCLDMALRAVKLSYLQIIAPLPLLTIIIPGQKKVFTNWIKKTTSCFLEVFIRLFIVVFIAYIMRTLDSVFENFFGAGGVYCGEISGLVWFLVKAATIVGLFWFIKIAPKLISDITGMDSKGFKLGIKDKLAESGAFQVVGGLGAGATSAVQNFASKRFWEQDGLKKKGLGFLSGLKSGVAGAGSGFARGYMANRGSKNYHDLVNNTGRAASDAAMARIKRENYVSAHGGNALGALSGHIADAQDAVKFWAKGEGAVDNIKADRLDKIKKHLQAINDFADKDSSVKNLNASYEGEMQRLKESASYSAADIKALQDRKNEISNQRAQILTNKNLSADQVKLRLNDLNNQESELNKRLVEMQNNTLESKMAKIEALQKEWDSKKAEKRAEVIKNKHNDIELERLLKTYADDIIADNALIKDSLQATKNLEKYADEFNDIITLRDNIVSGDAFMPVTDLATGKTKKGIGQVIGSDAGKRAASLRFEQRQKQEKKGS